MVWYGHNCGSCANSNKSPDMFWNLDPIRNVKNRRCCALSVSVLSGLAQLLGNKNLKTKGRRKQEKNGDFYCSFYCCQQLKMSRHSLRDFIFSLWGFFKICAFQIFTFSWKYIYPILTPQSLNTSCARELLKIQFHIKLYH